MIAMSKLYDVRPSSLLCITAEYDAYCFDEAVAYIISRIKEGETPDFSIRDNKGTIEKPRYSKASDLYRSMGYKRNSYTKSNQ